jgi:hypothetical protein
MTEAEWHACTSAQEMLDFLRGRFSDRKLRLAACGCARQILNRRKDGYGSDIVSVAERYADRVAQDPDLFAAAQHAHRLIWDAPLSQTRFGASMLDATTAQDAWVGLRETLRWAACLVGDRRVLFDCVRDIMGNPFCPVVLNPEWATCNVVGLGKAIYDERAFDRMPILADALEDAGCTNADILDHCHAGGAHVRGCWVVDLVLGRE